jgi:hypothetical protein
VDGGVSEHTIIIEYQVDMDALTDLTLGVVGKCVEVLESFSHIGVNTHFVKCACIVSFAHRSCFCCTQSHNLASFNAVSSLHFQDNQVAELANGMGFDVTLMKVFHIHTGGKSLLFMD